MKTAGLKYNEVWQRSFPSPALDQHGEPVTVRLFERAIR
jgi:hypothetical protein